MKKIVVIVGTTYIVLIGALIGYKVTKGDSCYYNYKKTLAKVEEVTKVNTSSDTPTNADNTGKASTENNSGTNSSTNSDTNSGTSVNQAPVQLKYASVRFTQQLFEGRKGEDVKKLQEILQVKKYYTGEITGTFDNVTKKALMSYQKDKNLYQDGVLGPGTWSTFEQ